MSGIALLTDQFAEILKRFGCETDSTMAAMKAFNRCRDDLTQFFVELSSFNLQWETQEQFVTDLYQLFPGFFSVSDLQQAYITRALKISKSTMSQLYELVFSRIEFVATDLISTAYEKQGLDSILLTGEFFEHRQMVERMEQLIKREAAKANRDAPKVVVMTKPLLSEFLGAAAVIRSLK